MTKFKEVCIHEVWNGDEPLTIAQLEEKIQIVKHKYGKQAIVTFDGGYNNITVWVQPSRKPQ